MTEKGKLRIRETILTLAGVWLFVLGSVGEFALAQSSRGALSEATESRLKAVEKDQQTLTLELEKRTIPIVEQMKSLRDDVQGMKDSQTWTNRALMGAVGGFLLSKLLAMMFAYKQSSEKSQ